MQFSLEDIVAKCQAIFRRGYPVAAANGWSRTRFSEELRTISNDCKIENRSLADDESFANDYWIWPTSLSDDDIYLFHVEISIVADIFNVGWHRYGKRTKTSRTFRRDLLKMNIDPTDLVVDMLRSKGFFEVPKDWLGIPVPGVRLRHNLDGDASLYSCLFND